MVHHDPAKRRQDALAYSSMVVKVCPDPVDHIAPHCSRPSTSTNPEENVALWEIACILDI